MGFCLGLLVWDFVLFRIGRCKYLSILSWIHDWRSSVHNQTKLAHLRMLRIASLPYYEFLNLECNFHIFSLFFYELRLLGSLVLISSVMCGWAQTSNLEMDIV